MKWQEYRSAVREKVEQVKNRNTCNYHEFRQINIFLADMGSSQVSLTNDKRLGYTENVSILLKRHMMPFVALAVYLAAALPFASREPWHVGMGTVLLSLFWLVEWLGVKGDFEDRVPRHLLVSISRGLWVIGLVFCVLDALWLKITPKQNPAVRYTGVAIYLFGLGLRLWAMRTLGGSFSYDLKVRCGQTLVTSGPYAWIRHPSYTGLLLWSLGIALWNPSLPGLLILLVTTLTQIIYRIRVEEQILEAHFGSKWQDYQRHTWFLLPLI